jgi:hypothetical protein
MHTILTISNENRFTTTRSKKIRLVTAGACDAGVALGTTGTWRVSEGGAEAKDDATASWTSSKNTSVAKTCSGGLLNC